MGNSARKEAEAKAAREAAIQEVAWAHDKEVRRNIVEELIATEATYVGILGAVVNDYITPLEKELKGERRGVTTLTRAAFRTMFSETQVLHAYHEEILGELRGLDWEASQTIGEVFVGRLALLLRGVYSSYLANYPAALAAYHHEAETNDRFVAFLETRHMVIPGTDRQQPGGLEMDLPSALITPVQRIPRYVLLLRELLKHTPDDHSDYANLELAHSQMERLTQYLNEQQRRAEGREAVLRVQGLLSNLGARVLAEPHRYLVKEGVLNVLVAEPPTRCAYGKRDDAELPRVLRGASDGAGSDDPDDDALPSVEAVVARCERKPRTVFLFNDIMVLAKEKRFQALKYKTEISLEHAVARVLAEGPMFEVVDYGPLGTGMPSAASTGAAVEAGGGSDDAGPSDRDRDSPSTGGLGSALQRVKARVAKRISIDSSDGSTAGGDEVEAMALTREGGVIFGFECADVVEKDAWLTAVHSVTSFASPEADGSDDGAGAPGGEVDDSCVIL